jgi:hypothetical protein
MLVCRRFQGRRGFAHHPLMHLSHVLALGPVLPRKLVHGSHYPRRVWLRLWPRSSGEAARRASRRRRGLEAQERQGIHAQSQFESAVAVATALNGCRAIRTAGMLIAWARLEEGHPVVPTRDDHGRVAGSFGYVRNVES